MTQPRTLFVTIFLSLIVPFIGHGQQPASPIDSIPNPEQLLQTGSVPLETTDRTFREAKYEGLRKRYQTIEGVVMVGVVNNKGKVLLKEPGRWTPPGGSVQPGEDWAAAARRIIKQQTGSSATITKPVLVEKMVFRNRDDNEDQFSAYILHLQAAFTEEPDSITQQPGFKWFGNIPTDAHPNHIKHIDLYLQ